MEVNHEIIEAIKAYWGDNHKEVLRRLEVCFAYSAVQYPEPKPEQPPIKDFVYCAVNLQELYCSDHAKFNEIQADIKTLIHFIAYSEE